MSTNQIKTMGYHNEHNQSNLEWNNVEKMPKASKLLGANQKYLSKN